MISINTLVNPSPDTIIGLLKQYGKVSVLEKEHNYQLTGKNNKTISKELLLIVEIKKNM